MVIVQLKQSASCKSGLKYNMDKMFFGECEILGAENVSEPKNPFRIRYEMRDLELNPWLPARSRKLGVHFAMSPGPNEELSDNTAFNFAKEYMEGMGYGEQPWVIFKHNDIERKHYHIVSTRAKTDNRVVDIAMSAFKSRKLLKELCQKYGLTFGRDPNYVGKKTDTVKYFNYRTGNTVAQITRIHEEALKYNFKDFNEYKAIMESFGIKVSDKVLDDNKRHLGFIGLNLKGQTCTNFITDLDKTGEWYNQAQSNSVNLDMEAFETMQEMIRLQFLKSQNLEELREYLKEEHIRMVIRKEKGIRLTDSIYFVDRITKNCIKLTDIDNVERANIEELNTKGENTIKEISKPEKDAHTRNIEESAANAKGVHNEKAEDASGKEQKPEEHKKTFYVKL